MSFTSAVSHKRKLVGPKDAERWSITKLREKLIKIGAKLVQHGRYVTFQLAEVAVPGNLFRKILRRIDELRPRPAPAEAGKIDGQMKTTGGVRLNGGEFGQMAFQSRVNPKPTAADGNQFHWRQNLDTVGVQMKAIWGMSARTIPPINGEEGSHDTANQ